MGLFARVPGHRTGKRIDEQVLAAVSHPLWDRFVSQGGGKRRQDRSCFFGHVVYRSQRLIFSIIILVIVIAHESGRSNSHVISAGAQLIPRRVLDARLSRGMTACSSVIFGRALRVRVAVRGGGNHSALILAALIIGHHFSISALCRLASACGVCWSRGGISEPRSRSRDQQAGQKVICGAACECPRRDRSAAFPPIP